MASLRGRLAGRQEEESRQKDIQTDRHTDVQKDRVQKDKVQKDRCTNMHEQTLSCGSLIFTELLRLASPGLLHVKTIEE
jgi:hypothetical protein